MSELYVDDPRALAELCATLRENPWLALDTEFFRESTYYPKLCLIQIGAEQCLACVDPLALPDLTPLLDVLYDPSITKVLHSAHQDLELFFLLRGSLPKPVFDTQIAATLLGFGDQISYAALVKAVLGLELDKSQTRTDWSRRPLSPAQVRYALDDVRHLRRIYLSQHAELQRSGRLEWLQGDFQALCHTDRYRITESEAWRRVKGHQQLQGAQLVVLRKLAAWRECRAITLDRPRRWVIGDEALLGLSRHLPKDLGRLRSIRGLGPKSVRQYGETLLNLIAEARGEPPQQWPIPTHHAPLTPDQEALVEVMAAIVRLRSTEAGLNPSTVAGRRELERLVNGEADIPLLRGWRNALIGGELSGLLQGKMRLAFQQEKICLIARDRSTIEYDGAIGAHRADSIPE
jgi:ribonuclease D